MCQLTLMEAPNKQSKYAARKQRKKAAKANASLSSADAEGFYLFSLSSHCFLILNDLLDYHIIIFQSPLINRKHFILEILIFAVFKNL